MEIGVQFFTLRDYCKDTDGLSNLLREWLIYDIQTFKYRVLVSLMPTGSRKSLIRTVLSVFLLILLQTE